MKIRILFLVFSLEIVLSCKNDKTKFTNSTDYNRGNLRVLTDDSFKSVTEALAEAYMISYPETKISVQVKKEDFGLLDMLHEKAKLIVMSREMTKEEISEYERITDLQYLPAKFAADAVVFIVPKDFPKNSISIDEIKEMLKSEDKNLVFDGTNSSNLNFVAQKLKTQPSNLKFSIISGNENLIRSLHHYPNKIGVVSLNTISRTYNKKVEELRSLVKILPVVSNNKTYEASTDNLKNLQYPFTRVIYFLGNEPNFQLANGLMRFSCTQLGQMVVEKEGLQPYNIYKREVQMR